MSPERSRVLGLLLLAVIAVLAVAVITFRRTRAPEPVFVIEGRPDPPLTISPSSPSPQLNTAASRPSSGGPGTPVVVHVAGAVKRPGLYRLPPGSRNDDAVKMAGGPTEKADLDGVNLALVAEDGAQLLVPEKGVAPRATPGQAETAAPRGSSGKLSRPGEGAVNINTASTEELQRLPGVGPSTAAKILAYRKEAGRFTAPDQLMEVSGIGEKKFAAMQPFVRVK